MSKIYENICEARDGHRVVRVWFNRELVGPNNSEDEELLWVYVHKNIRSKLNTVEYADKLSQELPRVNAVEVREGDSGSLVYPDWP